MRESNACRQDMSLETNLSGFVSRIHDHERNRQSLEFVLQMATRHIEEEPTRSKITPQ